MTFCWVCFGHQRRLTLDKTKSRVQGKAFYNRHFPGLCSPQELEALAAVPWLQHELLGATSQQEPGEALDPSTGSPGSFLGTGIWSTKI